MLYSLHAHVQVVTYKWLAREYTLPAATAKRLLATFAEAHSGKVSVTYLLSGYQPLHTSENGQSSSKTGEGGNSIAAGRGARLSSLTACDLPNTMRTTLGLDVYMFFQTAAAGCSRKQFLLRCRYCPQSVTCMHPFLQ